MSIFLAPHNDDETLFGAFTIQDARPLVVVVYDGHVQAARGLPVTWTERRAETVKACELLGLSSVVFLGFSDLDATVTSADIATRLLQVVGPAVQLEHVFAPAVEMDGHAQHNLVALAVPAGRNVTRYLTYTAAGKSVSSRPVEIQSPRWIARKLRALACYESQFNLDPRMGCFPHFLRDQTEYYAA